MVDPDGSVAGVLAAQVRRKVDLRRLPDWGESGWESQRGAGRSPYIQVLTTVAWFSVPVPPAPRHGQVPFRVPWRVLRFRVIHEDVPPAQMLYSLNASIVGLLSGQWRGLSPARVTD